MEGENKLYLGDSVYVQIVNGTILLTTENGMPYDPSNKIYLELEVFDALEKYVKRLKEKS
jgi:hypothetical protein